MPETRDAWTTLSVLDWTSQRFAQAGLESARLEAQILLAHGLGCDRLALFTQFDKPLKDEELSRCRELIRRRLAGEPVAYLTGKREFWSLAFDVDPRVLIPRPDSETVIEAVLALIADRTAALRIVDIGTGSGALAAALAREFPNAILFATDISHDAAEVARKNFSRLGLGERIEVRVGDVFAPLSGERFDLVVSNPPYVDSAELARLAPDLGREPALALDGGPDGLTVLRQIAERVTAFLSDTAHVVLEHGHTQGPAVQALLETAGFTEVGTRSDLGARPRVSFGSYRRS